MSVTDEHSPYVYVIQQGKNGPVKIGVAGDPYDRLERLQTGSPQRLYLLTAFSGGYQLERKIHAECAAHRLEGEWFRPHLDVMRVVKRELSVEGRVSPVPPDRIVDRARYCRVCTVRLHERTSSLRRTHEWGVCDACYCAQGMEDSAA